MATGLIGSVSALSESRIPMTACRFVRYFEASQNSNVPVSFWESVIYSFVLANSGEPKARPRPS